MSDNQIRAIIPTTADDMLKFAEQLVASKLLPDHIDTAQKAFTVMAMGLELGIGPIAALNGINVIRGRPVISGQLMLALVRRSGQLEAFEIIERTAYVSTIMMQRRGESPITMTFTIQDAAALDLTRKENYKRQPATMLTWRNVAQICRLAFSDVLQGFVYTPEEIDPDILVDEDGEIIVPREYDYSQDDPALLEAELTPGRAAGVSNGEDARGGISAREEQGLVKKKLSGLKKKFPNLAEVNITPLTRQSLAIALSAHLTEIFPDVGDGDATARRDEARYRIVGYLISHVIQTTARLTELEGRAVLAWARWHQEEGTLQKAIEVILETAPQLPQEKNE